MKRPIRSADTSLRMASSLWIRRMSGDPWMGRWLVCSPLTDRMDGWVDGWMYGKKDGKMVGWINGWEDGWMNRSMER